MRAKKVLISGLVVAALGYLASPYVALWRLSAALDAADTDTVAGAVDWDSVRQGLKQDIAEGVVGMPAAQMVSSNTLPPFGSGFFVGIASTFVDREVTPTQLVVVLHDLSTTDTQGAPAHIDGAFFDGPASFLVRIHAPGQDNDEAPLRVMLEWRGFGWKVTRAWVPQDLMDHVHFRT